VLIVDDEAPLRKALRTSLSTTGFVVQEAGNGDEALEIYQDWHSDLVLLDINMPGITGVEACRRLRALDSEVGIVMVTVRDSEDDMIQALEAGADDFVSKPYRFRELVARLRAVLRRVRTRDESSDRILHAGELELNLQHRTLKKAGIEVHLSPTEYDLIVFFFRHVGVPVTHRRLLRAVWGPEYGDELEYLRSYVRMLRKKLETDPARPQYILTEPWLGYRFRNPSEELQSHDQSRDPEGEL
jgi:two-component system KDP operon response regulator KdpE